MAGKARTAAETVHGGADPAGLRRGGAFADGSRYAVSA